MKLLAGYNDLGERLTNEIRNSFVNESSLLSYHVSKDHALWLNRSNNTYCSFETIRKYKDEI